MRASVSTARTRGGDRRHGVQEVTDTKDGKYGIVDMRREAAPDGRGAQCGEVTSSQDHSNSGRTGRRMGRDAARVPPVHLRPTVSPTWRIRERQDGEALVRHRRGKDPLGPAELLNNQFRTDPRTSARIRATGAKARDSNGTRSRDVNFPRTRPSSGPATRGSGTGRTGRIAAEAAFGERPGPWSHAGPHAAETGACATPDPEDDQPMRAESLRQRVWRARRPLDNAEPITATRSRPARRYRSRTRPRTRCCSARRWGTRPACR